MYWTYENWVHAYARVRHADCSHCNHGQGTHDAGQSQAGQWLGPFDSYGAASGAAKYQATPCGHCTPSA